MLKALLKKRQKVRLAEASLFPSVGSATSFALLSHGLGPHLPGDRGITLFQDIAQGQPSYRTAWGP